MNDLFDEPSTTPKPPSRVRCEGCDTEKLVPLKDRDIPYDWVACGESAKYAAAQPWAVWCPTCWATHPANRTVTYEL